MKKSSSPMTSTVEADNETSIFGCASSTSDSSAFSLAIPSSYYDRRWMKAASLLRTDKTLMTSKILISALKNKAPLNVIKFFLSVNPKAAGIPKEGPTPLQVAVQHNATTEVVKELIAACPFALIVTTSAEWLDPLSYARQFRSSEADLIALLSRPLGSWIHPKEKAEVELREADAAATPVAPCSLSMPPMKSLKKAFPKQRQTAFSVEDKEELQNVKKLCLSVMKGQRRLIREVGRVKDTVERNGVTAEVEPDDSTIGIREEVSIQEIQDLENSQKRNLKAHLIALDMKEQAMRAYVQRMEHKILQSLEVTKQEYMEERSFEDAFRELRNDLHNAARRMDEFVGSLEHRMEDLDNRMDRESQANANFRSGLQQHLGLELEDVTQQEGFEVISVVENTPTVFATPYQKPPKEEALPLCPKETAPEDYPKSCLWPRFRSKRRELPPHIEHSLS